MVDHIVPESAPTRLLNAGALNRAPGPTLPRPRLSYTQLSVIRVNIKKCPHLQNENRLLWNDESKTDFKNV